MRQTLNGGEANPSFPATLEQLERAGLCPECLAAPVQPALVTGLDFTESEIDQMLSDSLQERDA